MNQLKNFYHQKIQKIIWSLNSCGVCCNLQHVYLNVEYLIIFTFFLALFVFLPNTASSFIVCVAYGNQASTCKDAWFVLQAKYWLLVLQFSLKNCEHNTYSNSSPRSSQVAKLHFLSRKPLLRTVLCMEKALLYTWMMSSAVGTPSKTHM